MSEAEELCLVTTSHREFWMPEVPMLLIGQWCVNGHSADEMTGLHAVVAEPYGMEDAQRDADHAQARAMEQNVLADLCRILNAAHGVQHTERYWNIVLGHWLRGTVTATYNRVRTIQACLKMHQPTCTVEPDGHSLAFARVTSNEAAWAFNDPWWDGNFCLRVIRTVAPQMRRIRRAARVAGGAQKQDIRVPAPGMRKKVLLSSWRVCQQVAQMFVRRRDAFIINSYLSRGDEIRLQLRLGQFPQLWKTPQVDYSRSFDPELRRRLRAELRRDDVDAEESVLRALLFELMPLCYLEGYQELLQRANRLPWPDAPKFIFTSNSFGTDELFKVWTAERVERGVQYVVGQHGNNYGTHRYINPSVEEATSDKFITWGWSGHLPQHVSGFNLKLPAKSQLHADPQGGLLLSEVWAGHRTTTWDNSQQFLDYLRDQFAFVGGLSPSVRSRLSVRLHHDWARLDWNEPQRWKQYAPDLELDYGFESIRSKIGRARLIVHSYDSTGMLETLAQGIPTLAFWQNRFGHLRDEVRADYQRLVDVGIVHLRADTAAATVNENWDRLDEWWGEEKRRAAVRGFCEKYSRRSFNPASEMVRILLND